MVAANLISVRRALFNRLRKPAYSITLILLTGIAVGTCSAAFSVLYATVLKPLAVFEPKQLFFVANVGSKGALKSPPFACYRRFLDTSQAFDHLAAVMPGDIPLRVNNELQRPRGEYVTPNYFKTLGVVMLIGRPIAAARPDEVPLEAVISESFWKAYFGGEPSAIGRQVVVRDRTLTITGICKSSFSGLTPGRPAAIFVPIGLLDQDTLNGPSWSIHIVGRLNGAAHAQRVQQELSVTFDDYLKSVPELSPSFRSEFMDHIELRPAARGLDDFRTEFWRPLATVMLSAALLWVLTCTSVAGLHLAQLMNRRSEYGIRLALGATPGTSLGDTHMETIVLSAISALVAALVAVVVQAVVQNEFAAGAISWNFDTGLEFESVVVYCLLISITTLFVLAISVAFAKTIDTSDAFAGGGRSTSGRSWARVRTVLVAVQVGFSTVLIFFAALFATSFQNLRHAGIGIRETGITTMSLSRPLASNTDWDGVLRTASNIPGVEFASLSTLTPADGRYVGARLSFPVDQRLPMADRIVSVAEVSEKYFDVFGIELLAGRSFDATDFRNSEIVPVVISERAATLYFQAGRAVGGELWIGSDARRNRYRVIGIVRDVKQRGIRREYERAMYVPLRANSGKRKRISLALRANSKIQRESMQRFMRRGFPELMVAEAQTVEEQLRALTVRERVLATVGILFGGAGLLLAIVGVYGLGSYVVSSRRREISIRLALGSGASAIHQLLIGRSLLPALFGVAGGLLCAGALAQQTEGLLYKIDYREWSLWLLVAMVVLSSAGAAAYLPARGVRKIELSEALRSPD